MIQHNDNNDLGVIGSIVSIFLNILAYLDQKTITFALGCTVATLTIIYYIIKIYNEFLNTKKNKKDGRSDI